MRCSLRLRTDRQSERIPRIVFWGDVWLIIRGSSRRPGRNFAANDIMLEHVVNHIAGLSLQPPLASRLPSSFQEGMPAGRGGQKTYVSHSSANNMTPGRVVDRTQWLVGTTSMISTELIAFRNDSIHIR
jgi:hypothetical protein